MTPELERDLAVLAPDVRERLGRAETLEDVFQGFQGQLAGLELIAQDEFSQDLILPLETGFLVVSVT